MSFDLGIWHADSDLTQDEAGAIYTQLCEAEDVNLDKDELIVAFYEDLTAVYPELDSLSDEDADNVDLCPWSNELDRMQGALIVSCVFSKAEIVHKLVHKLAAKHGLSVFNPQTGTFTRPA